MIRQMCCRDAKITIINAPTARHGVVVKVIVYKFLMRVRRGAVAHQMTHIYYTDARLMAVRAVDSTI